MSELFDNNERTADSKQVIQEKVNIEGRLPKDLTPEKLQTIALASFLTRQDNDSVLFLDTETTGIAKTDEIVELSVLNSKGEVLFDSMFKPTVNMNPEASKVSGITDEMLNDKPRFVDKAQEIKDLLADKIIVGWNIPFDLRMLDTTFSKFNVETDYQHCLTFDAMNIASDYFSVKQRLKQAEVMQCLGFNHIENHRAEDDVRDMIDILKIMGNPTYQPKDIIDFVPETKRQKIEIDRQYGSKTVNVDGKSVPAFQRYSDAYRDFNGDIGLIQGAFGVSRSTVHINLYKAMYYDKMGYQNLDNLDSRTLTTADKILSKLGYTNGDCFDAFQKSAGGLNYRAYSKVASNEGLNLSALYNAALIRSLRAKGQII